MTRESTGSEPSGSAPSTAPADAGAAEGAGPLPYVPGDGRGYVSGRPDEIDVDRGPFVGVMIGIAMFVTFQAMIVGSFQTGIIGGETPLWAPLKFAGITQGIYVFPTALFFVNRKCPRMAAGFIVVAAVVFVAGLAALIFA